MRGNATGPGGGDIDAIVISTVREPQRVDVLYAGEDGFFVCPVPESWSGPIITSKRFGNV